ncbi:MAG: HAMP domain-containing histidine kinase [Verrucomicrobiales bacterium]|nr:HAMP domain-containing histidine kinase [Verrucomicrobiales bacterium]
MKKLASIFAVAVLVPSIALAFLAMRSLRDQEIIVHSQRALLHQSAADELASDLNTFMEDVRLYFPRLVNGLVDEAFEEAGDEGLDSLSRNFDQIVRTRWTQASVGCVVIEGGEIISPTPQTADSQATYFLEYNRAFLADGAVAEVYPAPEPVGNRIAVQETEVAGGFFPSPGMVLKSDDGSMKWTLRPAGTVPAPAPSADSKPETPADYEEKVENREGSSTGRAIRKGTGSKKQEQAEAGQGDPGNFQQIYSGADKPASSEMPAFNQVPKTKQATVIAAQEKLRSARYNYNNRSQTLNPQAQQRAVPNPVDNPGEEANPFDGNIGSAPGAPEPAGGAGGGAPQSAILEPGTAALRAPNQPSLNLDGAPGQSGSGRQRREVTVQGDPRAEEVALQQAANTVNVPGSDVDQSVLLDVRQSPAKPRVVNPLTQIGQVERFTDAANDALFARANTTSWSSLEVNNAGLSEIMGDKREGAVARFLSDGLHILLWYRHPRLPNQVFWAELDLNEIRQHLADVVAGVAFFQENKEVSLALLDAEGNLVAQTMPGFEADWKRPFVASEVGQILPRWEVAAYLIDPEAVIKSADVARLTLWLLVPILLAAIGFGSFLIFRDLNREMHLARQKTDFVSNVSHELKTPLTSIRMFSDLLSTNKSVETDKRTEYSGIISREAARLTRLINNLLDFSRMDRGDGKYNFEKLDAVSLARETLENYRMQLEADGCELEFRDHDGEPIWIEGDRDALSQVLLNLLSNADKYACSGREIILEVNQSAPDEVEWRVLDRGPGIRRKDAAKIFEKFYRADDSLATGIQGSGLGLTLARQIARGHGGDIKFCNRDKGGSCFSVVLPVSEPRNEPTGSFR